MAFGQFNQEGGNPPIAEINTTPLVDVMLVLLVVFMITAPLMSQSIQVQLPQVQASAHEDKPEAIRLTIDATEQVFWNDQVIDKDVLAERFTAASQQDPAVELHLRADQAVPYRVVAKVIAAAQGNGVSKIGFLTDTPK